MFGRGAPPPAARPEAARRLSPGTATHGPLAPLFYPACPRRYGLLGPNGCGKSTLLRALGARDIAIPEHIDIYYLDREMPASDHTALEAVMMVDEERARLEAEAEKLMDAEGTDAEQRLEDIYER